MDLKSLVRDIPDFPKKGIIFKDIMPMLGDRDALRYMVDAMFVHYFGTRIDKVVSAEARGFIFGPAVAYHLGAGFVAVRKPGKLPYKTRQVTYALEYGYNLAGQLTSEKYPSGRIVTNSYDANGRLSGIADASRNSRGARLEKRV